MVTDNRIPDDMEDDISPEGQLNNIGASMQADTIEDLDETNQINSEEDMKAAFAAIQSEAETSISSAELRLLYRRGADLIELLDTPGFQERAGDQLRRIRRTAEKEFAITAKALNRRGAEINVKADYAKKWQGEEPARYTENM